MHPIQLIVGLANPGKEYANTRHNAGAWFLETIAEREHLSFKKETKFHGLYAQTILYAQKVGLLIPTTYMNLSGRAVQAALSYQKLSSNNLLVAHDDIDLPAGTIKLKYDGGDGGHNGLKDIISHLGTKQFYRLRIGVGRPSHGKEVVDFVLSPPSKHERMLVNEAIDQAIDVLHLIIEGNIPQAMQILHSEK